MDTQYTYFLGQVPSFGFELLEQSKMKVSLLDHVMKFDVPEFRNEFKRPRKKSLTPTQKSFRCLPECVDGAELAFLPFELVE